MSISIYNTLTRTKEKFVPLEEGRVKMYVCGPTVYNHIHIGNARPAIFFDTVRNYLEYRGFDVHYVQNFTDVDDKIIHTAREEGKSAQEISEMYIEAYLEVVNDLGNKQADLHPKVTENMQDIIAFIDQLIEKGLAYEANGDVYYRTHLFSEYGKLSHQRTDELLDGVRIEVGEHKESPIDFTLWKETKADEISWDSPWGKGRPGWHIECSALIKKYLGDTIDIHGGGIDLSFPHHENEIAQTEGLTKKPLANYWMHNALLTIDDKKMSKSLGNFVRVNEVLEHYSADLIRYFMLSGHYRSPINYSEDILKQAQNALDRLCTAVNNVEYALEHAATQNQTKAQEHEEVAQNWRRQFISAMDDDFNTANAISTLFELSREVNVYVQTDKRQVGKLLVYASLFREFGDVLGLKLTQTKELLDDEVEQLLEERIEARKQRNFARADEIRDELEAQGILLEDTREGLRWRRK